MINKEITIKDIISSFYSAISMLFPLFFGNGGWALQEFFLRVFELKGKKYFHGTICPLLLANVHMKPVRATFFLCSVFTSELSCLDGDRTVLR